jgi:hypothetical protein
MSRSFLTGLNLNKNELLNARIQNLANPPSNPVTGQIYYDTDTDQINVWDGTAWAALAAGGNVGDQIQAAIDELTTDDIEEGEDNLYYLSTRARGDAAALLTGATLTNITITGDGDGLTITAENGVADSDTDDLTEGTTNLYFTDERAQDAVGNAVGNGLTYTDSTGVIAVDISGSSDVVGTTDSQTLSNKTISGNLSFINGSNAASGVIYGGDNGLVANTAGDIQLVAFGTGGNVILNANGDVYVGSATAGNEVVTLGGTETLTNKTISDFLTFNDGIGASSTISADVDDLIIDADRDLTLTTGNGDIILNADGAEYIGSAITDNRIATRGYVTNRIGDFIGDNTVDGTPGNTVDARIATALSDAQAYADGLVQGLNVKDSVRVAADTDIDIANATEVDGVTLASGDRVLLKNQSTATENGIYVFTTSLARAADADPVVDELNKGSYVLVTSGTYAATGWLVSAYSAGVTTWTQFSAANEYTAGDGISIVSNEIAVALDSDSLAVSGAGLKANLNVQGGLDNDSGIFINTGTGLTVNGSNQLTFASGYGVQKYAVNNTLLEPTSNVVSWVVTHGIGTRDVTVQVFENSTYTQVEVDVARTNTTTVTLSWVATANVAADTYRVVVVG